MPFRTVFKREIKYLFIITTIFAWLICCLAILKFYFFWDTENICKPKVERTIKIFINEIKESNCNKYKDIFETIEACEGFKEKALEPYTFHILDWDADAAMGVILFNNSKRSWYSITVYFSGLFRLSCKNVVDFKVIAVR